MLKNFIHCAVHWPAKYLIIILLFIYSPLCFSNLIQNIIGDCVSRLSANYLRFVQPNKGYEANELYSFP